MLKLDIEIDPGAFDTWKLLDQKQQRQIMVKTMAWYIELQRRHIRKGIDVHGKKFKSYSPQYKRNKRRAGRLANSWLRLSGDLLRSQVGTEVEKRPNGWVLTREFRGTHAAYGFKVRKSGKGEGDMSVKRYSGKKTSNALIALAVNEDREFIGLSVRNFNKLVRVFLRHLDKFDRRG